MIFERTCLFVLISTVRSPSALTCEETRRIVSIATWEFNRLCQNKLMYRVPNVFGMKVKSVGRAKRAIDKITAMAAWTR